MITLYSGTPGSGKSLDATIYAARALRHKTPVILNYSLSVDSPYYHFISDDALSPAVLEDFARWWWSANDFREDGIVLIIDECQLLLNSRDWDAPGRRDWLRFFSQHRKYGFDIILIAQFDEMIDKQIRSLVEYEEVHRKLSNFGFYGKTLSLFFGGSSYISVKIWYSMRLKVSSRVFHARKSTFRLYDTRALFAAAAPAVASEGSVTPEVASAGASAAIGRGGNGRK